LLRPLFSYCELFARASHCLGLEFYKMHSLKFVDHRQVPTLFDYGKKSNGLSNWIF
jgi:hypothetical protein